MSELFNSSFFSLFITFVGYFIGLSIKKKYKIALFNPIIIGSLFVIAILQLTKADLIAYEANTQMLTFLLYPATVCLAILLFKQLRLFEKYKVSILCGIVVGVLVNYLIVLIFALIFKFDQTTFVSLVPKSITTAIGISITQSFQGIVPITIFSIVVTGLLGYMIAEPVLKFFKITHPVAKGIAIGTSSHIVGTSKAVEMGETEGALSSLSIVVAGLFTLVIMLLLNTWVTTLL